MYCMYTRAPCPTASAHTQTHSNLLLTPVMTTMTTTTSNQHTSPALRCPHQQPVRTSRLPHSHPSPMLLNSVTCASSLHVRASLWCLAATRGSVTTVLTLSAMDSGFLLCRTLISIVLRVFSSFTAGRYPDRRHV